MKSKVLFITFHYLNGNGGGVYATRSYLNAFANLFSDISVLYPDNGNPVDESILANVKFIPALPQKSLFKKTYNLLTGKVNRFTKIIPELLSKEKYDLIIFDNSRASISNIEFIKKHNIPIITIHHNFETQYISDNENLIKRLVQLPQIKNHERNAIQNSVLNLCLTVEDRRLLSNLIENNHFLKSFELIGTFEFKEIKLPVLTDACSETTTLIITGSLSSPQTLNSLKTWIKDYFPLIKEEFKNFKIIVAGKNPSKELENLCLSENIELHANPESMDPLLEKADYYICPTEYGGGMKLRIMDGLKFGLPVITHKVSARGYESFISKGFMKSYDDCQSFREALKFFKIATISKIDIQNAYSSIFSFKAGCNRLRDILQNHKLLNR